ncbi:MAG: hypothetical protein ACLQVL_08155 [Terriglobia bacterium]
MTAGQISRRHFLSSASLVTAGLATPRFWMQGHLDAVDERNPLKEFDYSDVTLASDLHNQQLDERLSVLTGLSEHSLLKPFRKMCSQPAPGDEFGGWYLYDPKFDGRSLDPGFAPAATSGQWVSALARAYAINGEEKVRDKVLRLNRLYAKTISGDFYENNRFPAYCYDKLVRGRWDSHRPAADPNADSILDQTTDTALPHLPGEGHRARPELAAGKGRNLPPGRVVHHIENL